MEENRNHNELPAEENQTENKNEEIIEDDLDKWLEQIDAKMKDMKTVIHNLKLENKQLHDDKTTIQENLDAQINENDELTKMLEDEENSRHEETLKNEELQKKYDELNEKYSKMKEKLSRTRSKTLSLIQSINENMDDDTENGDGV